MSPRPTPSQLLPASVEFRPLRTLRFALIVAVGFALLNFAVSADHPSWQTAAGWAHAFGASLVFALCISFTIAALYWSIARALGARAQSLSPWQLKLFYWGTPLIGWALAMPFAFWLTGAAKAVESEPGLRTTPLGALAFALLVMAIFFGFFAVRARQLRAERQAAEAQLRLLQAQMEPHFLFNTLANVVGLIEADPPRAKAMLESFTDYLRASLISLRAPTHSLGAELDLVEAYLRVVKVRMDDRLRYRIEVPAELRTQQVPALSVQPLVENAVVHGLEPSIDGGEIVLSAHIEAARLVLRVRDDGIGLGAAPRSRRAGSGTALNNIRARLQQVHGKLAGLQIEAASPRGVLATLTLPAGTTA